MNLKQVNKDGSRHYELEQANGEKINLISVTTLLSKFQNKDALIKWKSAIGEEEANNICELAAIRGNQTHKLSEQYLLKQDLTEVDIESDGYKCFIKLLPILKLIKPIQIEDRTYWLNEETKVGFAGTVDMWSSINGSRLIIRSTGLPISNEEISFIGDIKSWSKPKYPVASNKNREKYYPLLSYYLQLSAYTAAINQRTKGIHKLNKAFILGTTTTCKQPFIYYLNPEHINYYWKKMKELLTCHANDSIFNWTALEKEVSENNLLGERVDILYD